MNEITRIHLAQTPFNIEVTAKKELEKYLSAIKATLHADDDTMREIEARIIELLAERGVTGDKVVTSKNIAAIKEQLGAPNEFIDAQEVDEQAVTAGASKRLMRDQDRGVLGGVLAGIAAYIGIDPIWVRLIAIILALLSFGTVLLIYVVLWIAIPPAKTAAEKLQMAGRQVTLATLKEQSKTAANIKEGTKPLVVALRIILGIGFALAAIGALVATGFAVVAGVMYMSPDAEALVNAWLIVAFLLAVVSGLLFVTLNALLAYASLVWRFTRQMMVATVLIVIAGIVLFSTATGLGVYGGRMLEASIQNVTHTEKVSLDQLAGAKKLVSTNGNVPVTYKVTDGKPYAEFKIVSRTNKLPQWSATRSGDTLELNVHPNHTQECDTTLWRQLCLDNASMTIYGPALSEIQSREGHFDYQPSTQADLGVTTNPNTTIRLTGGNITSLHGDIAEGSIFNAENSSVGAGQIKVGNNASVAMGVMASLNLIVPDSCPVSSRAEVSVARVSTLRKNDQLVTQSDEITADCARIIIDEPQNQMLH
jgi:phage shock protein PspC (stress-responsive transcriptional regulator)